MAKIEVISRGAKTRAEVMDAVKPNTEHLRQENASVSNVAQAITSLGSSLVKEVIETERYSQADEAGEDLRVFLNHHFLGFVSVQVKSSQKAAEKFTRRYIKRNGQSLGVIGTAQSALVRDKIIVLWNENDFEAIKKSFKEQLQLIEMGLDQISSLKHSGGRA